MPTEKRSNTESAIVQQVFQIDDAVTTITGRRVPSQCSGADSEI